MKRRFDVMQSGGLHDVSLNVSLSLTPITFHPSWGNKTKDVWVIRNCAFEWVRNNWEECDWAEARDWSVNSINVTDRNCSAAGATQEKWNAWSEGENEPVALSSVTTQKTNIPPRWEPLAESGFPFLTCFLGKRGHTGQTARHSTKRICIPFWQSWCGNKPGI